MKSKIFNFKLYLGAIGFLFIAAGFISCEKNIVDPPVITEVSFQTDILPIFSKCTGCHGGAISPNLTSGMAYESLVNGNYVTLPAEESKLYKKIIATSHTAKTTDVEKEMIRVWIEQGSQNN